MLIEFEGVAPEIAPGVYVAPGAAVIGDVRVGEGSSIWFGATLRGDVHRIRVGARVNVQDGTVVHVSSGRFPTTIDDDVTIGHRAIIHGCTLGRGCLIGMGAVVMDGATVGASSIIGAGALVTPGTQIPEGVLAVGSPARVRRPLTEEERAGLERSAEHYSALAARYISGACVVDE